MKLSLKIGILLSMLWLPPSANAVISPKFKNPNYDDHITTVEGFVLGRSCYSLRLSALSLDCNPAFLADSEKRSLNFNLNLDDRIDEVYRYARDLEDHNSRTLINRILDNPKPLVANEVLSIWGQYDWWAISLTPMRLGSASAVVNPSLPRISIHTTYQQELSLLGGFYFDEEPRLKVGGNLRYVRNHQIRDEFSLFDVMANDDLVRVNESNTVYFEPALSYSWGTSWQAEASVVIAHLPLYESDKAIKDKPRPEVGFSSTPDFLDRRLTTTLHYTGRPDIEEVAYRFRFGGVFRWTETLSTQFSLAGEEFGLGVMGRIDSLVLGLGWKSEMYYLYGERIDRVSSTLFQAGLTF